MIQRNNNLSVLPFYTSIDEQNHRKSYSYGEVYPLYTPVKVVPPFQIMMASSPATISQAYLYKADGTQVGGSILGELTAAGLTIKTFTSYNIVVFPSSSVLTSALASEGQYYIKLSMSNGVDYYSDIMTVVGSVSSYVKVEWQDDDDLVMDGCRIVYDLGSGAKFKNWLYLNTELGKPEYTFEEEGETRDGLFFPEKMLSFKRYKCTILASEYLCDVMRFIRLSDTIKVTDSYGREYPCDTFLITPKWETQGNIASVEIEFTANTIAKRIGRNYTS